MKRFLYCISLILLLVPTIIFAGCKDSNKASSVKNKIYYVTNVVRNGDNISKEFTDKNLRIIFLENSFIVEFSHEKESDYGFYLGTFTTNDDIVNLSISEVGGTYTNYQSNPKKNFSVFKSFRYRKGILTAEFVLNSSIYSFTLKQNSNK